MIRILTHALKKLSHEYIVLSESKSVFILPTQYAQLWKPVQTKINYETLEKLSVLRPENRLQYISEACRDKVVLDIGCLDETALEKRNTKYWLHKRIAQTSRKVVGIDNSEKIPTEGIRTSDKSIIYRGDGVSPAASYFDQYNFDIVIAGEFIEHIESPLLFFKNIKEALPGKELIISTPNGVSFANTLLGTMGREVQHQDHIHTFTFKILNTLCQRAKFKKWSIIPYHFYATEMILSSTGIKRTAAKTAEVTIKCVERFFPLLSFGYIARIRL
tara:strand:- start:8940 stop:9761 length:822 start_codon:yes stop_codon:yes gene_type:complete